MGSDTGVADVGAEDVGAGNDAPGGERRLVERARAGDPDAWERLYRNAYPRLFGYARRRLATMEQAEEAVSETMVRAMHGIHRYRPSATSIECWLFGIARNVVLEAYRAGRRRPADRTYGEGDAAVWAHDPELVALRSEERQLLARAFARLSEEDQDLLELRVLVGLDARQVGEITGRRPGAVRMAQSRALARLRLELGSDGMPT